MPQRIPESVLTPLEVRTPLAGAKLLWKPYTVSQEKTCISPLFVC